MDMISLTNITLFHMHLEIIQANRTAYVEHEESIEDALEDIDFKTCMTSLTLKKNLKRLRLGMEEPHEPSRQIN